MNNYALIVAGGNGLRMGSKNKPYMLLAGKPIIYHTLKKFEEFPRIQRIVIVAKEESIDDAWELVSRYSITKVQNIVTGGGERQHSVYNGLRSIDEYGDADFVFIHDAVRPLVSPETLEKLYHEALFYRAVVPAMPSHSTMKKGNDFVEDTLDRQCIWCIQTPQVFYFSLILRAHETAHDEEYLATDDAALVERIGERVRIIRGNSENIKITVPEDLVLAESILTVKHGAVGRHEDPKRVELKIYAQIELTPHGKGNIRNSPGPSSPYYETVNIYDHIIISKDDGHYQMTGNFTSPADREMIEKVRAALESFVKRELPCSIHVIKGVPVFSKPLVSSAREYAVISGFNQLFRLHLSDKDIQTILKILGLEAPIMQTGGGKPVLLDTLEKNDSPGNPAGEIYVIGIPRHKTGRLSRAHTPGVKNKIRPAMKRLVIFFSSRALFCGVSRIGPAFYAAFASYKNAEQAIQEYGGGPFKGEWYITKSVDSIFEIVF